LTPRPFVKKLADSPFAHSNEARKLLAGPAGSGKFSEGDSSLLARLGTKALGLMDQIVQGQGAAFWVGVTHDLRQRILG
jgi:hypothetical protein